MTNRLKVGTYEINATFRLIMIYWLAAMKAGNLPNEDLNEETYISITG